MRLEHNNISFHISVPSANNVARMNRRGRYPMQGRGRGQGRSNSQQPYSCGHQMGHQNQMHQNRNKPTCQVCGKIGHVALKCYHRFDHSYQAEDARIVATAALSSYDVVPNWYIDTGATDRITNDLEKLAIKEKYQGKDQVQVANGSGMNILHAGHSQLSTPFHSLKLNNVLHIPQATRHLLSVHRLATDNNIFFEIYPSYFLVKDQTMKQLLLRGKCEGGLYPIKPSHIALSKKGS